MTPLSIKFKAIPQPCACRQCFCHRHGDNYIGSSWDAPGPTSRYIASPDSPNTAACRSPSPTFSGCITRFCSNTGIRDTPTAPELQIKKYPDLTFIKSGYQSGKSTARGYNAPCLAGVVHFCGVRPNAPGQWGQAGQNAECFPGAFFPPHLFLSTGGSLSANSIRDVS